MFECTSRHYDERGNVTPLSLGRSQNSNTQSRVGASWESNLTSLKNDIAILTQTLDIVQGGLKRVEKDGAEKQDIQNLKQSLQAIRGDMHQLEVDDSNFRAEFKFDIGQRLQRLEDAAARTTKQLGLVATCQQLERLDPGIRTVTSASLEVVQEVNGPSERGETAAFKELEERINLRLSEIEQRLSKVENKQIPLSNYTKEAESFAEENHLARHDSLTQQGQKEPDTKLREVAREDSDIIDIGTCDGAFKISEHIEYEFNSSIWDVAVFAFTQQMSPGASIVLVICLVLNTSLLVLFAWQVDILIQNKMDLFNEQNQAAYHFWRVTAGHSIEYQNPITGASMVSSICNAHRFVAQSSLQLDVADQLSDYLTEDIMGIYAGRFLCSLSLIVWYLTLVAEGRSIFDVLRASINVPVEHESRFEQDQADSSTVKFAAISQGRRFFIAGTLLGRFAVVGLLGWQGSLYLISEIDPENMILNSMALQMMLNFDEMLVALLPKIPQSVTCSIRPLPIRVRCLWWDTWGLFVVLSCALISIFAFFQIAYMNPFIENLKGSWDGLCGGVSGSWDFVVGVDELGIPWAAPTPPSVDATQHGYYEQAIIIAKNSGFPDANLESIQRGNVGPFMQVASGAALDLLMVDAPEFRNPTDWQLFDPFANSETVGWTNEVIEVLGYKDFADQANTVYNNYLKFLLGEEGNVSCAQVPLSLCTKPGREASSIVYRKLCPKRCGCDLPTEGTIANIYGSSSMSGHTGCPSWSIRRKAFVDAVQALPCVDTDNRTQMALWARGAGEVVHSSGNMLADQIMSLFDVGGCPEVVQISFGVVLGSRICHETSLPSICPQSCGCDDSSPWTASHTSRGEYCPYSCNRMQPLCITFDDSEFSGQGPYGGIACTFPFKYKGKTHYTCTYEDSNGVPWCAVTLQDGDVDLWGDCHETPACVGSESEVLS